MKNQKKIIHILRNHNLSLFKNHFKKVILIIVSRNPVKVFSKIIFKINQLIILKKKIIISEIYYQSKILNSINIKTIEMSKIEL